jgi:hypothetical protein
MAKLPTLPRINPKRDLPYLAALAQTAQFALAGSIVLGPKGWFFGGVLGLLVSLAMVYSTSQIADIAAKRQPYALAMTGALGVLSPIVIAASVYLELPAEMAQPLRVAVAACWGAIPDVSIAVVGFVAGKGMVATDTTSTTSPQQVPALVAPSPAKRPSKKPAPTKQVHATFTDAQLVAELAKFPGASNPQLAAVLGVSAEAIRQRRAKLTPAQLGYLNTPNA